MLDSFQKPGQFWGLRSDLHTVMITFSESINCVSVTSQTQRIFIFVMSSLLVITKFHGRLEREKAEYHEVCDAAMILRNVMDAFIQLRGSLLDILFDM